MKIRSAALASTLALSLLGVGAALVPLQAHANDVSISVHTPEFGIRVGSPRPAPVVVQPVVVEPAPTVVYAPPPRVVHAPPTVVYAPPPRVVYAPPRVVYEPVYQTYRHPHHRHWHKHHRHHRHDHHWDSRTRGNDWDERDWDHTHSDRDGRDWNRAHDDGDGRKYR